MRFKHLALSFAALGFGLSASAAMAADIGVRVPPRIVPVPVAAPSWTSCYVGGNVGYAWSHTDVVDEVDGSPIVTVDGTGYAAGGQIGCDLQLSGPLVVGIQGMFDWSGLTGDGTSDVLDPASLHGEIPWFATVTGRLGFAVSPEFLLYAKGGVAFSHTNSRIEVPVGPGVVSSASYNSTGWTAGIGGEWRFARNWSLFAEYDYLGFPQKTVTLTGLQTDIGDTTTNIQTVLFGVNLRFGG